MILIVIISNNVLLNLLIIFIYHLILDSLLIQYTRPQLSIIGNWFFLLYY